MSQDVIKTITDAETSAREENLKAQTTAKNMIAEAERKGQAAVSEAISQAEEEAKRLILSAEEEGALNTAKQQDSTSNLVTDIYRGAEARLNQAASLIVERIIQS